MFNIDIQCMKHFRTLFITTLTIYLSSCVLYKKAPISIDQYNFSNPKKVLLKTPSGRAESFDKLIRINNEFYAVEGKKTIKFNPEPVSIYVHSESKSILLYVGVTAAIIAVTLATFSMTLNIGGI